MKHVPHFFNPMVPTRVWKRIQPCPISGCWIWTGENTNLGYGLLRNLGMKSAKRAATVAHRAIYILLMGEVPDGLVLDHLCRMPCCVNPAHLEPVTNAVNILRGTSKSAINAVKTHCMYGHEFTPSNTKIVKGRGRCCRACQARWARDKYHETARLKSGLP